MINVLTHLFNRLRQFKALGIRHNDLNGAAGVAGAGASAADLQDDDGPHSRLPEPCSIQQRNCEAETLRVFRLITGQVFGRLLEESQPEENDDTSFDDLHYPGAAANAAALANWDQVMIVKKSNSMQFIHRSQMHMQQTFFINMFNTSIPGYHHDKIIYK